MAQTTNKMRNQKTQPGFSTKPTIPWLLLWVALVVTCALLAIYTGTMLAPIVGMLLLAAIGIGLAIYIYKSTKSFSTSKSTSEFVRTSSRAPIKLLPEDPVLCDDIFLPVLVTKENTPQRTYDINGIAPCA